MIEPDPVAALKAIAGELRALGRSFAVVGGFGVSVRGEVRFTRDVDLAVTARDDADVESLVRELRARRYEVVALVEHDERARIATVRLRAPTGIAVDLLTASSGIESEIVGRSSPVSIEGVGVVPVARAEELLAMKVLSMDERRLQDRIDAGKLLDVNRELDLPGVRANLQLIEARGFNRHQDLAAKLQGLLDARPGS
jgi:predicted nucleotidyltransferase